MNSAGNPPPRCCARCGAEVPPSAPGGICPDCAFGEAMAGPPDGAEIALDLSDIPPPGGAEASPVQANPPQPASEPQREAPSRDKPGDRIGRYKLLEEIGEGGCGVVYVAEQEQPMRRRVALKVIKLGMDTRQVIARFEAERQALAMMDHPNIAKVLDAGATETGRPYFVMELVKGVHITDYCDRNHLSTTERLGLFIQVCHAIQHAHQKGIIHRDIKPSNILVTLHDGVPVPKVIDFGIAKATTNLRLTDKTVYTALSFFIGTPAYMSPEQAELSGLDIDTRSDIYSLGVLLYELLTGSTPFDPQRLAKAAVEEIRRIIREEEPPRPSTRLSTLTHAQQTNIAQRRHSEPPKLQGSIRGDLDWIVMNTLEKDRQRRYESASGLAADIQRHLNSEPVLVRPPSQLYRLQRMVRRNKLAFAATAAVLLTLISCLGLVTWLLFREKDARQTADTQRLAAKEAASRETTQRLRAEEALSLLQIQQAERLFSEDKAGQAVALLASVVRRQPENRIAAERLMFALAYQLSARWPLAETPPTAGATTASFSPDGRWMITASGETARVWDARTGQALTEPLRHAKWVNSAAFSPDGQRVVTASDDNTARVWDARTGQALTEPLRHESGVVSASFSPDGKRVVTASDDNTARVWDARTAQALTVPLKHAGTVQSAAFSLDGLRVVTASYDNTARVWDAQTGQAITAPVKHAEAVYSASFSPDGLRVVTASDDKTARVWDARTGMDLTEPLRHGETVYSAEFSPDGLRVVTASEDNTARVWDARTGQALTEPLRHERGVVSASFSPDGLRVVTASDDCTARVWDARTGHAITESLQHALEVRSASFSPDGQRVVTAAKTTARTWNVQHGQALAGPLQQALEMWSASFSPDGLRVVKVSDDNTARVWDARTGQALTEPLRHRKAVYSASFSPDGLRVVTASDDETARVWDARTGIALTEPLRHGSGVSSAAFSPDCQRVVTTSGDNAARVWDFPNMVGGEALADLAEGMAQWRLNEQGVLEVLPREHAQQQLSSARAQAMHSGGVLAHWTEWLLGDPDSRPISPNSVLRRGDYCRWLLKVHKEWSLREVILLDPTNSLAFARLGKLSLEQGGTNETKRFEARWLSTHALQLAPDSPEVWRDCAGVLAQTGNLDENLSLLQSATERTPYPPAEALQFHGRLLAQANLWQEALATYTRAANAVTNATPYSKILRRHLEHSQSEILKSLDRVSEAVAALGISSRTPGASARLLDLTTSYNRTLDDTSASGAYGNALSSLPSGVQMLAGVQFDVRGMIQLAGANKFVAQQQVPTNITGIAVGQQCQKLQFLHGTCFKVPGGTPVSRLVMHLANGQQHELTLRYGIHVRDWWEGRLSDPATNVVESVVAWTGSNPITEAHTKDGNPARLRLFRTTWVNPTPEVEVTKLDFISAMSASCPFLIAITAEP